MSLPTKSGGLHFPVCTYYLHVVPKAQGRVYTANATGVHEWCATQGTDSLYLSKPYWESSSDIYQIPYLFISHDNDDDVSWVLTVFTVMCTVTSKNLDVVDYGNSLNFWQFRVSWYLFGVSPREREKIVKMAISRLTAVYRHREKFLLSRQGSVLILAAVFSHIDDFFTFTTEVRFLAAVYRHVEEFSLLEGSDQLH